jgi:hypothetical protein
MPIVTPEPSNPNSYSLSICEALFAQELDIGMNMLIDDRNPRTIDINISITIITTILRFCIFSS